MDTPGQQHDKLGSREHRHTAALRYLNAHWTTRKRWIMVIAFGIEVLVWQQFMIAMVWILYSAVLLLFGVGGLTLATTRERAHAILASGVVVACMGWLAVGAHLLNTGYYSPWAFEQTIQACKAYHQDHGRYPDHLLDVSPEYIAVVPPAKLSVVWWWYHYMPDAERDDAAIGYVIFPPFYRKYYTFQKDTYKTLD